MKRRRTVLAGAVMVALGYPIAAAPQTALTKDSAKDSNSGAAIEPAHDLARDARDARAHRQALIVLYTTPGCPWCEKIRREYLRPMLRNPAESARIIVREIDITGSTALIDATGHATTHRAHAQAAGIRLVPVTAFIAPDGSAAAEPIIGFPPGDFFGAYLDERIEAARTTSAARPSR